jgi:hypothetical protein
MLQNVEKLNLMIFCIIINLTYELVLALLRDICFSLWLFCFLCSIYGNQGLVLALLLFIYGAVFKRSKQFL